MARKPQIPDPKVKVLLRWLNGDPLEELCEDIRELKIDFFGYFEHGYEPLRVPLDQSFDFDKDSEQDEMLVWLYQSEETRRSSYKTLRDRGFFVPDSYDQFCGKHLIPTDPRAAVVAGKVDVVRKQQAKFIKNIINHDFSGFGNFFKSVQCWYGIPYGGWHREGMTMQYRFRLLPGFGDPIDFIGYSYRLLANMILIHSEPRLEFFSICNECGNIFYGRQRNVKFCSNACKMRFYRESKKKKAWQNYQA